MDYGVEGVDRLRQLISWSESPTTLSISLPPCILGILSRVVCPVPETLKWRVTSYYVLNYCNRLLVPRPPSQSWHPPSLPLSPGHISPLTGLPVSLGQSFVSAKHEVSKRVSVKTLTSAPPAFVSTTVGPHWHTTPLRTGPCVNSSLPNTE